MHHCLKNHSKYQVIFAKMYDVKRLLEGADWNPVETVHGSNETAKLNFVVNKVWDALPSLQDFVGKDEEGDWFCMFCSKFVLSFLMFPNF